MLTFIQNINFIKRAILLILFAQTSPAFSESFTPSTSTVELSTGSYQALNAPVKIEFENIDFQEFISVIGDSYNVNLFLDPRAMKRTLHKNGTAARLPKFNTGDGFVKNYKCAEIPLRDALTAILKDQGLVLQEFESYAWISNVLLIQHDMELSGNAKKYEYINCKHSRLEIQEALQKSFDCEFTMVPITFILDYIETTYNIKIMLDNKVVLAKEEGSLFPLSPQQVTNGHVDYFCCHSINFDDALTALLRGLNLAYEVKYDLIYITSAQNSKSN